MTRETTDGGSVEEADVSTETDVEQDQPTVDDHIPDDETESETQLGVSENILGALAYFWGFVSGGALYIVEQKNPFVRFHAAQSLVLSAGLFAAVIGLMIFQLIVGFLLGDIPYLGFLISLGFGLLWLAFGFAMFLLYVYMMFSAFQGNEKRLPVIASIVDEYMT